MNFGQVTKLLGNRRAHAEQLQVAAAMFVVTALYVLASRAVVPDYAFNVWEFLGTWTGLVCVWLSRTENILCWPWGIASSALLGVFFGQIGLPGQQWLNWIYFVPISLWSWPEWAFGGAAKTELPVTRLSWEARAVTALVVVAGTYVVFRLIGFINPASSYPWLDSLAVAASVVAQYLLGLKKTENWLLWLGPVNMVSIVLFSLTGAYMLVALYLAFCIHAGIALRDWAKAANPNAHVQQGTRDREVLSAASGS